LEWPDPKAFLKPADVVVCESDTERHRVFKLMRVAVTDSHTDAIAELSAAEGFVLLAVKPQTLPEVAEQLRGRLPEGCGVISILAGTPIAKVAGMLGRGSGVIRAMPNTAVAVKLGITALSDGPGVTKAQSDFAVLMFGSLGDIVRIDESMMDAFTALAGSGPAYLYYLAEAMMRAGVEMGFDQAIADRIVRVTALGASALLTKAGIRPGEVSAATLRAAVTSKGGTTEAAVKALEDRGVMKAMVEAIIAGRDRGRELGGNPQE
jgi:pyrroline-5-carboxylate reductase